MSSRTNLEIMAKHFIFILLLATIFNESFAQDSMKYFSIKILQGDSVYIFKPNRVDTVILERKKFSIRAYSQQYEEKKEKYPAIQLAISPNLLDDTHVGQSLEETNSLHGTMGLAGHQKKVYDVFYIADKEAHHYIYYENENSKRAHLISKENNLLELEFPIKKFNYKEKDLKPRQLPLKEVLLLVLINRNLNAVIDENELTRIVVRFK
jgi:hypothetical protein